MSFDPAGSASSSVTSTALAEIERKLASNSYIRSRWFQRWTGRVEAEVAIGLWGIIKLATQALLRQDNGKWATRKALKRILADTEGFRGNTNSRIVEAVIRENANLFNNIEKYPLTPRQCEAAATDEDATLVIAGAGTGKTSTILAKIGLLLKTDQCGPAQILAISFTKKSAAELADRVREKLGVEMDIHTFHKLGLKIIAQGEEAKPSLASFLDSSIEKAKHIDRIIEKLSRNSSFQKRLVEFFAYHRLPEKMEWQFSTLAEYSDWLRSNRVVSLDGIPKKSYEECLIANWLILNGVRFVYEDPYEHNTRTHDFRQYCPDFHLLDESIYIEHFGVDHNNRPAPYIDAATYQQSMEWKRQTHRHYQTQLVETYSWERRQGFLLSNLEQKLKRLGCKFAPISEADAISLMNKGGMFTGLAELVGTFLTLYKGNGSRLTKPEVRATTFGDERLRAFLEIFDPIFEEYECQNQQAGQIDFEDMISKATAVVKARKFASPYRYILVDEFQDISPGRAELVQALQTAVPDCALFCVGDDWQSIYRFAGSDIGAMTHFHSIFGPARRVPLDTTFRFDDYAITTSSRFVLKNPVQIQKDLKAIKKGAEPSIVLYKRNADEAPLDWSLTQISDEADGKATVLILDRYNRHLPDQMELKRLTKKFPHLTISAMSVHASKGLESDYVIVGLRGGQWGFPATKTTDPLLDMVLTQPDEYEYGEERRLFYVALTRARRKTILDCETGQDQSSFATELANESEYQIKISGIDTKKLVCSWCKSGTMLLRDGTNGKFYGCSNFPLCENTQQTCPSCRTGLLIPGEGSDWHCTKCDYKAMSCPRCGSGVLLQKNGAYGPFLGCSNYRDPDINCRFTRDIF
jgi:DNA helicase-4